jgi:effector-binding domain-containing protein
MDNKLQISSSKTLKLSNVLIREIIAEDFENYFIVVEQIDNYIKSKGALPIGPLVQLTAFEFNKFDEAEIKIHLMRQANNFFHKVEPPYAMEPVIRVPDCLYVRYTGPEEKLKFAYDKLNLMAFELDIPLVGDCYTIFVDKQADTLVADVFMEKEKDEYSDKNYLRSQGQ